MNFQASIAYIIITVIIAYAILKAIDGIRDTVEKLSENRHEIAQMSHELERKSRKAKPPVLETCPLCEDFGVFKQDSKDELVFYVECRGCGCFTYEYPGNSGDKSALKDWNRGIVYLPDPEPEDKPPVVSPVEPVDTK